MWTRQRTLIGGQTAPDDWTVLRDGRAVGRVMQVFSPVNENRAAWAWFAWCHPASDGRCNTLGEALEQVRQAVG